MTDWNKPVRRGKRLLRRPLYRRIALALAAVLALYLIASYRGGTGFDVLRRYLHYGSANHYSADPLYLYEPSANNRFAMAGESLVVLSESKLSLIGANGLEIWSETVRMSAPALLSVNGRAAAYDVGGTELHVLDAAGERMALTFPESEPILSARLNRNGWLTVVSGLPDQPGTKNLVRVYNPNQDLAFAFYSSHRFVSDACATDDNGRLAMAALGQEEGVFISDVVLYRLNEEEAETDFRLKDALALEIVQKGSSLAVVSDTCLTFARTDGEIQFRYDYGGEYLRDYNLDGDGFSALLLNRYASGGAGRLVTVDGEGQELGSLEIREEVLGLSAAGRYLAVLYADRMALYNQALQPYASLTGTDSLRGILTRADGTVLMLGASAATLFLP